MQSGTKLVLGIFALAISAGVLSWAYRYEATHDASVFWGPTAIELIAKPSKVVAFELSQAAGQHQGTLKSGSDAYSRVGETEISNAPGLSHLRNALLTDGNYYWAAPPQAVEWRWGITLSRPGRQLTILFDDDFTSLGHFASPDSDVHIADCSPMASILRQYFKSINAFPRADPSTDSPASSESD